MNSLNRLILLCVATQLIWGCTQNEFGDFTKQSLLSYGAPISVMAPDSVQIKKEDWIVSQSISLRNDDVHYFVQLWMKPSTGQSIDQIKSESMEAIQKEAMFSKIIQEDPAGFILEKQVDENTKSYDFRFFKSIGDTDFTYQTGLIGLFSLEQVQTMYKAVQIDD